MCVLILLVMICCRINNKATLHIHTTMYPFIPYPKVCHFCTVDMLCALSAICLYHISNTYTVREKMVIHGITFTVACLYCQYYWHGCRFAKNICGRTNNYKNHECFLPWQFSYMVRGLWYLCTVYNSMKPYVIVR